MYDDISGDRVPVFEIYNVLVGETLDLSLVNLYVTRMENLPEVGHSGNADTTTSPENAVIASVVLQRFKALTYPSLSGRGRSISASGLLE